MREVGYDVLIVEIFRHQEATQSVTVSDRLGAIDCNSQLPVDVTPAVKTKDVAVVECSP